MYCTNQGFNFRGWGTQYKWHGHAVNKGHIFGSLVYQWPFFFFFFVKSDIFSHFLEKQTNFVWKFWKNSFKNLTAVCVKFGRKFGVLVNWSVKFSRKFLYSHIPTKIKVEYPLHIKCWFITHISLSNQQIRYNHGWFCWKSFIHLSMGILNSPSSRVVEDSMPFRGQILRCIRVGWFKSPWFKSLM